MGLGRNVGLAAGSLVAALALFEAALRFAGFRFSFAPERVEFGWPNPVYLDQRFERDRDLFWVTRGYYGRLAALADAHPGERLDVAFLGDSTEEMGLYPDAFLRLANELAPPGETLVGANLGVSGWSSYQGRRQLERDVAPLRPRFVTINFGWNDHWVGFALEDKDIHAISDSPLAVLRGLRVGQLLTRAHYAWRSRGRELTDSRVTPDDFGDNLRAMIRTTRDAGGVPVLLTAPTSHRPGREPPYLGQRWLRDLSQLVPVHQRYVEVVRAVAADTGEPLCDLAGEFDRLDPAERDREFMDDGIHLRPAGDERFAAGLLDCFRADARLAELWRVDRS